MEITVITDLKAITHNSLVLHNSAEELSVVWQELRDKA